MYVCCVIIPGGAGGAGRRAEAGSEPREVGLILIACQGKLSSVHSAASCNIPQCGATSWEPQQDDYNQKPSCEHESFIVRVAHLWRMHWSYYREEEKM